MFVFACTYEKKLRKETNESAYLSGGWVVGVEGIGNKLTKTKGMGFEIKNRLIG